MPFSCYKKVGCSWFSGVLMQVPSVCSLGVGSGPGRQRGEEPRGGEVLLGPSSHRVRAPGGEDRLETPTCQLVARERQARTGRNHHSWQQ